jgi:predicted metal-binding membrane protein
VGDATIADKGRALAIASIGALAAAAWLALWLGHGVLHHHHGGLATGPSGPEALMFIGGWTVMTVAMMLPTAIPVVVVFDAMVAGRSDRAGLIALLVLGYVLAWSAFGAIVYVVAESLRFLVSISGWLEERAWIAGPVLLVLAGAFQFTSLKDRCLDRCRSPFAFVLTYWSGRRPAWEALSLGLDNGRYCVGCCWALMLLMLTVATGSLMWMLVLAMVMAIEKNVTWGRRMARPLGTGLILWGTALLVAGQ